MLLRISLFFALLFSTLSLWAQNVTTSQRVYPEFQLMRASEDYSFLKNDTLPKTAWERFKYIHLSSDSYLSLGADTRVEFQMLNNEDWQEGNIDRPVFLRFQFHTDWHFNDRLRLFAQLKSAHTFMRNGPVMGLNVDRLDAHQLFLSYKFGKGQLEIGRQEIIYGSRRLISLREGTNVRQSFDGIRWKQAFQNHKLDLFYFLYNPQEIGIFDNRINSDQSLWGVYDVWTPKNSQNVHFDLYYLGVRNEQPSFEEGSALEVRHSFGLRHSGKGKNIKYNNEAVIQFGSFGSGNIFAWTLSSELYYQFQNKIKLTTGLKADVISGDRQAGDGNLQTFNPLYPRGGYFGLLAVIGPANLIDLHPSIQFQPAKSWSVDLDWDVFWRYQINDGIYFPSGRLNVAGSDSAERFIGHQAGIRLSRVINRHAEIEASYFYFFAGPFLEELTPGDNFSQFGLSFNYKL